MLFWFSYGLAFPLAWYENRYIVCGPLQRPLGFTPDNQSLFWIVRLLITYGSLFGLWWSYSWRTAVFAFVVYFAFERVTFRHYFNRQIRIEIDRFLKHSPSGSGAPGEQASEEKLIAQAHQYAHSRVAGNMKGEFF